MDIYYQKVFLICLIGLTAGFTASYLLGTDSNCKSIEEGIKANQSFNGTLTCYPPGAIEVNLTEKIENQTKLECVCRKVQDGRSILLPITKTV